MSKPIVHVHHRGDRGVDGILRLIELAGHDGPLETMLTAMCDELAAIADADIASIYVREDDTLVMRGNHGFPASAIGTVLGVGEGITGLVAECMRPVSAAHAAAEAAYKPVPGLGEERFPVFAGVPLIGAGAVIGVLVLQRRKKPFASDEVTLATALGAPVTLAIERRRATAVRSARLHGIGHGGADRARPRRASCRPRRPLAAANAPTADDVDRAITRLRDDLGRALKKLASIVEDDAAGAALDRFALALAISGCASASSPRSSEPSGLRAAVRDYARAPYRLGTQRRARRRHRGAVRADRPDRRRKTSVRPGAIWVADKLGAFVAIAAVARGASALVAADTASPAAIAIARAAHLPIVTEVAGLFGWARPGDLLAVDGATGTVLVHPAATDIERLRHERDS